jgi:hypothetical protein
MAHLMQRCVVHSGIHMLSSLTVTAVKVMLGRGCPRLADSPALFQATRHFCFHIGQLKDRAVTNRRQLHLDI